MPARPAPRRRNSTAELLAAERFVDVAAHHSHIDSQRLAVEGAGAKTAKRIAYLTAEFHGLTPVAQMEVLAVRLDRALERTMQFGYVEAQRELREMHDSGGAMPSLGVAEMSRERLGARNPGQQPTTDAHRVLAYAVPDAGRWAYIAQQGRSAIRALVSERARRAAFAVGGAVATAATSNDNKVTEAASLAVVASKTLHNYVLELVGETLNLGRTAGALESPNPPEYALRSEMLDERTCEACDAEHGEIYQTASPDFFDHMPPSYCYGGGRCRGIYVWGA